MLEESDQLPSGAFGATQSATVHRFGVQSRQPRALPFDLVDCPPCTFVDRLHGMLTPHVDVGFVFRLHHSTHVDARPLYQELWGVVCPADAAFAQTRNLASLDPSHEVVRQWGPEFAEWHRTHIPEGTPALSVGTTSMLGAIMRGTNLWSIVPAGMGHAIVSSDPSFVFQPLEDCPPPGPAAHMLLPKKALPWVGSAVDVLMQSVLNVVDSDENLTRLHS